MKRRKWDSRKARLRRLGAVYRSIHCHNPHRDKRWW